MRSASIVPLVASAALTALATLALAACKPPASDDPTGRGELVREATGPSMPLDSPDTEGAIWAPSTTPQRIIYGQPGKSPLIALACMGGGELTVTRLATADEGAQAFFALVGNSHVARIPVDATQAGSMIMWQGSIALDDPDIEVLTGPRRVTATLPGAGSVILNPSAAPRELIETCRASVGPKATPTEPAPPASPE